MGYFIDNYGKINFPIAKDNAAKGLRNAQLGAIHAISSHFTLYHNEPALVVMPTGSGKTAVLNLSAYELRANRVLVISSSVMVRGQIFEEFSTLKTLKASSVFHKDLPLPNVIEVKSPIKSIEEWENFKNYDVVIGIPNSINEGINEEFTPSTDLFDLVLVDEAHHVPAYTWSNIVKTFAGSKKVFFTATPFRRDKKEIEGRLAYYYPLSKAYEDKIFGDIGYYPVVTDEANVDLAIARETEKTFNKDKAAGLVHSIMVRTETKNEAESLAKLYSENTALKLKKVDSSVTYNSIKKTIEKLKYGELDGVICVDMLGEGFDFPNLKIAAIHSPKKSLANTLQFIGRFARTNAENIGEAKFLAIPNDIEIGKKKLYEEGAIWNDIIKNLSEEVIEEEDEIKSVLDTFENETLPTSNDEISFYNINPYCHVKVYKAGGIKLQATIDISGQDIIYHSVSEEYNSVIFITKEVQRPKWMSTDDLINVNYFFFFVFYDEKTGLLFIHSSIKTNQFYDELVEMFSTGGYSRISKRQLNKVLVEISNPEFFNIGMQNKTASSGESYRIIAGPNAENTIKKSHGKNYANGHVFMKGMSEGVGVTVGYSSGSKVWSNAYEKIPELIKWCKKIGEKIVSDKEVKTNTGFDNLPIGQVVESFPLSAHSANWNGETFSEHPFLLVVQDDEQVEKYQLLEFSIEVCKDLSDLQTISIDLIVDARTIPLKYDFQNYFQYREVQENQYIIDGSSHSTPLLEYLNDTPLQIYLLDFATVIHHEYYAPPNEADFQYDPNKVQSYDWNNPDTDITKEFYEAAADKDANGNRNSIHETMIQKLVAGAYPVLIYDHGSHEIADFISFSESGDLIDVNLYHIKASTGNEPGDRVADVYEVCMQAVKSQVWVVNKHSFREKLLSRVNGKADKFLLGNEADLLALFNASKRFRFSFTVVQPGISMEGLSSKLSYILAATDDSLTNNGYEPLIVLGS